MIISFQPIGIIHTPFEQKEDMPIQSSRSEVLGKIDIYAQYIDGLEDIQNFSHLILLYAFHQSQPCTFLKVKPFLDDKLHGVFATRFPCRPNPLGLSVIRLLERQDNLLYFSGADMLNGTPLLDIKPYIADFDIFPGSQDGWYRQRKLF